MNWTEEELLLALELTVKRSWRGGNEGSKDLQALSRLLREVNFPGIVPMPPTFRSTGSVGLKVSNFIGSNPRVPGGGRAGNKEVRLVESYYRDPEGVLARARRIRARAEQALASDAHESSGLR